LASLTAPPAQPNGKGVTMTGTTLFFGGSIAFGGSMAASSARHRR
jgi:hypothetical protein